MPRRTCLLSLVDRARLAAACTRIYELPHWVETSELLITRQLDPDEHDRHIELLRADIEAVDAVAEVGVHLKRLRDELA